MDVRLVNAYKHGALKTVTDALRGGISDVVQLESFHMHMCSEEYPNADAHDNEMETLEAAWPKIEGPEHAAFGILPSYMIVSSTDATVWHKVDADLAKYTENMAQAKTEGALFKSTYEKDVQFVMARTNHHVHSPTKKGRLPLAACRAK